MMGTGRNERAYEGEKPPPDDSPELRGDSGSLGEIVRELVGETTALVRAEMVLARSEMQHNLERVQRGMSAMAGGAIVLAGGVFASIAAAVLALAPIWPDWLAALVVGAVVSAVGAILLAIGRRSTVEQGLKPRRTLASLGETRDMAREEKERAARRWR